MASSMVTSILPIYIVYSLHQGVDKLGFVVATATFISYAFRVLFGYLSDKLGVVKPFVVAGYALSAITKPLLYFSSSWQSVAMLRGLERIGKAIRSATKDSLISAYSNGKSGKTFGFHKTMDIAGELLGSIIVFSVLFYIGQSQEIFKNIFLATLIPGVLAVIIVIFFVEDAPYKYKKREFNLEQDYHLLPILFIYFGFIFFIFNDSFFLIKAKEAGFETKYIPLFVVLLNLTQTIFSYLIGLSIDKFGAKKILFISFIFGMLAIVGLYFNFIIISFIFLGVFVVSSLNAIRAYISKEAFNKATIYGIFYAGVAIFGALGALVSGILWQKFGFDIAFYYSISGLIFVFIVSIYS
jgi:MFS family permease